MKPATSMTGTTHHVSIAPPVRNTSVTFIASSIAIIETSDIPIAVLNASAGRICRHRMIVSNMMDVKSPLKIARDIIQMTGQLMPLI